MFNKNGTFHVITKSQNQLNETIQNHVTFITALISLCVKLLMISASSAAKASHRVKHLLFRQTSQGFSNKEISLVFFKWTKLKPCQRKGPESKLEENQDYSITGALQYRCHISSSPPNNQSKVPFQANIFCILLQMETQQISV